MPRDRRAVLSGTYTHFVYPHSSTTQLTNNSPRHASTLSTQHQPRQCPISTRRTFSTTPSLLKKGGKAARDESKSQSASQKDAAPAEDPSDFTALEADIAAAVERLKDDLSKLRAGGRFNPELLENLRVQPDKNSGSKVRLSDVAQVVPKGRTVQVLVGEKDVRYSPPLSNCYVTDTA
jgi:multidrug efflux pump subunit AcrB